MNLEPISTHPVAWPHLHCKTIPKATTKIFLFWTQRIFAHPTEVLRFKRLESTPSRKMRTAFDRLVEPVARHGVWKRKERVEILVARAARVHRDEFERLVVTHRNGILPIVQRANLRTSLKSYFNWTKPTNPSSGAIHVEWHSNLAHSLQNQLRDEAGPRPLEYHFLKSLIVVHRQSLNPQHALRVQLRAQYCLFTPRATSGDSVVHNDS